MADDPTDFDRIIADIDRADPDALLGYLQTTLATRGRLSPELFWRLVRHIAVKLTVRLLVKLPGQPAPAAPGGTTPKEG